MQGRGRGGSPAARRDRNSPPAGPAPRYPAAVRLAHALLLLSLAGCAPSASSAERALPARTGNVWADCYRRFESSGDPATEVARLGEACALPAGFSPLEAPHVGAEQGQGDPPERFVLRLRRGCYRAFAVGGPGVDDLDVAIYDAEGRIAAGDVSRDRWPVVPPRGPLCVEGGAYTVAVSVAQGRGEYVMQIWGLERQAAAE